MVRRRRKPRDPNAYVNVRVHPELHRIAARSRAEGEASITDVINRAICVGLGREDLLPRVGPDSPAPDAAAR